LVSICYTQLFNNLCEKADDVYGGRLPVHVRCLIDEAANIGQIPRLEKLMATIRSREISACLVLQAQSQLKALYKDNADTIVGNCDSAIFLGGKEKTTLEDWSKMMGKETIYSLNTSETKGNSPSFSNSYQKLGRELMTVDELAAMDSDSCILMLRGLRPFMSKKYDITRHPLYKQLADYDRRNRFDTRRFLSTKLKVRPDDSFTAYEDEGTELLEPPPPEAFAAPPAQSS
jgi:type IV secretion system protein VirD4